MSIVTIQLMGGLGNQLFQIFTAMAYGLKHNIKYIFADVPMLHVGRPRPTYWDTFLQGLRSSGALLSPAAMPPIQARYQEPAYHYTLIPATFAHTNTVLFGYFQSAKYFDHHKEHILAILDIPRQQRDIQQKYLDTLAAPVISMHFRAGDYLANPSYHPILTKTYYERALRTILDRAGAAEPIVLYFCEKEAEEHAESIVGELRAQFPVLFLRADDAMADWEQMLLMSCCDHHIVANSSFSWWGAYLKESHTGITVCPARWYGPSFEGNTRDLPLPNWRAI